MAILEQETAKKSGLNTDVHEHNTRSAKTGISGTTTDRGSMGFRVPKEWSTLSEELQGVKAKDAFKRRSKMQFIKKYKEFECRQRDCRICGSSEEGWGGEEGGGLG